jgi:hypothetical protein
VALLTACAQPHRSAPEEAGRAASAAAPSIAADAEVFRVVPAQSELHILVFRGGALGRFGHNHVIAARELSGLAWRGGESWSGFELTANVSALEVDAPELRAAYGAEFATRLTQQQIEGTRRNMLSEKVLDAARFPRISLRSSRIEGARESPRVWALVTVKDVTRELELPLTLESEPARVIASGALDLKQTDFGITPFTAALGALEVQDVLHLEYRIVAERRD